MSSNRDEDLQYQQAAARAVMAAQSGQQPLRSDFERIRDALWGARITRAQRIQLELMLDAATEPET